jgi:nucleoside-diphosphate-sugar epimerase
MADVKLIAMSGSSGLIGRVFNDNLSSDIKVVHITKASKINVDQIEREVRIASGKGAKHFLHLGWPASTTIDDYKVSLENYNALEKTLVFKRACDKFGLHFIGIGSTVDRFPDSKSTYSITKYAARQIFSKDILENNITWLRPFYIFNQDFWPKFIHQNSGKKVLICNDLPRNFIHINDVTRGIESVIRCGIQGRIDLGSQFLRKPSELCAALNKLFCIQGKIYSTQHKEFEVPTPRMEMLKVWNAWETEDFFKGVL